MKMSETHDLLHNIQCVPSMLVMSRKHIDDLKKYSWHVLEQKKIKPTISKDRITPQPWNCQQW